MCFVMYYRFLSVKNHSLNTTFEYLFARKQEKDPESSWSFSLRHLCFFYISGLQSLIGIHRIKCYFLTFLQGLVSFLLDMRIMYENILSIFSIDKSIALLSIKPFYFAFHFWLHLPVSMSKYREHPFSFQIFFFAGFDKSGIRTKRQCLYLIPMLLKNIICTK